MPLKSGSCLKRDTRCCSSPATRSDHAKIHTTGDMKALLYNANEFRSHKEALNDSWLQRIDSADSLTGTTAGKRKREQKRRYDVNLGKPTARLIPARLLCASETEEELFLEARPLTRVHPPPKSVMQYSEGGERRWMSHVTGQMCAGRRGEKGGLGGKK